MTPPLFVPSRIKSYKQLIGFAAYCVEHPGERFWQALRNWSKYPYLLTSQQPPYVLEEAAPGYTLPIQDTFYFENRRHDEES